MQCVQLVLCGSYEESLHHLASNSDPHYVVAHPLILEDHTRAGPVLPVARRYGQLHHAQRILVVRKHAPLCRNYLGPCFLRELGTVTGGDDQSIDVLKLHVLLRPHVRVSPHGQRHFHVSLESCVL